jgi:3-isopropylmalate dehydrogenase
MKIGILEGDDIGHEVVPETVKVIRAAAEITGLAIDWHSIPIGRAAYDTLGHTLPPDTLQRLEALDGWILGPIGHMAYPKVPEAVNPHPILRKPCARTTRASSPTAMSWRVPASSGQPTT